MIDQSILFFGSKASEGSGGYVIALVTRSNGNTTEALPLDKLIPKLKKYNQIRQ